ncbi:MAG: InlB B-repeat-containing protein, partial [Clostridia bacterium]|nr:InlB B-repeat-containing protein [Clostridia bacterium]
MKKSILLFLLALLFALCAVTACNGRNSNPVASNPSSATSSSSQEDSSSSLSSSKEQTSFSSQESSSISSGQEESSSSSKPSSSNSSSEQSSSSLVEIYYKITFNLNEGSGATPNVEDKKVGDTFTIPTAELSKENCIFEGWAYGGDIFVAGQEFTMPASNVEFVAVWTQTYSVIFNKGDASGTAPTLEYKKQGDTFTIPSTSLYKEWHEFVGWQYNEIIYKIGDTFTMPNSNVEFIAIFNSLVPGQVSFSQDVYYYNRLGGLDLELPISLNGATIYYVKVDGEIIPSDSFSYDQERQTLVLKEDYALSLADGDHEIKPITDSGLYTPPTCKVVCRNSIATQITSSNVGNALYGLERAVGFSFDFNGTYVKSLKIGSTVVSSDDYWQSGNMVYISNELISKYLGELTLTLRLSNNDVYTLKTYSNVIFTSDYDVTTIHNTTQSNIGHNPLYQYYDNVSIVNAPTQYGFSKGRVLKITPSTVEGITYDCYGYLTLKGPSCSYMWYNVGYTSGKYYAISFDYATEGTTRGDLVFRTENSSWSQNLLLGSVNDGKVRRFSTILSGDTIGYGTILWAKFVGGGGNVYIDNIKITELGTTTSVTKVSNYNGEGNYTFTLNNNGFVYDVLIDG